MKLDIPVEWLIVTHGLCVVIGLVIAYGIMLIYHSLEG